MVIFEVVFVLIFGVVFLTIFSVLQGARRDPCDDGCDGRDCCDRIIIIDSQWFIIVMILNTVATAMMAVRWPVMTFRFC